MIFVVGNVEVAFTSGLTTIKLCVMDGDEEVSEERGEDGQERHDVVPFGGGGPAAPAEHRHQGHGPAAHGCVSPSFKHQVPKVV